MTILIRVLAVVCLCWPSLAVAQTRASTAEIAGRVSDVSGGVLPGAGVTATHLATGVIRIAVADGSGRFVLAGLPVGRYDVRAELSGFSPRVLSDIRLLVGDRVDLDLVLDLGPLTAAVTVEAPAEPVDARRASVSAVISSDQISGLPINGRNFISFAQLTPGVAPARGVASQDSSGLTFVGQRGRANNISLDGLDHNGVNLGNVRGTISQDAAGEFQVLTSGYAAEFGKASGGLVNIVSRSGTNTPAGSVFLYARNDALNGREYFEDHDGAGRSVRRDKAPFEQQQFGATFGGPIRRDSLFFFGSFERQTTQASRFVAIDDSAVVFHPFAPVPLGTAADILQSAGLPVATGYQPFDVSTNLLMAKVDYYGAGQHWIAGRIQGATRRDDAIELFGGTIDRSRAVTLEASDVQVAGWWTAAPSGQWLHDLRFQSARDKDRTMPLDPNCQAACDLDDEGGPAVDVLGVASVGRNTNAPGSSDFRYLQILDTVSRYGERHDLRAGVDFGLRRVTDNHFPLNFGGRFIFADLPAPIAALFGLPAAVSAIQAVAIGLPVLYVQGYGQPDAGASSNMDLSVFAQDDWRIAPGLTAQLGVRYQVQRFSTHAFDVPGVPSTYTFPADRNNLAPRLAVAWDPRQDQQLVVRAAYGMSYERTLSGLEGSAVILNPNSGVRTLVAQGGLPIFAWSLPGRVLPEFLAGSYAPTTIAVDPGLRTPYAHHASFGFERRLGNDLTVSATAVFVEGRAQVGVIDYNPLVPALGPGRRPDDLGGQPGTSGSVLQYTSFGSSSYRGLLVSMTRRFVGRSQILVSYALSKAEDNATDFITQGAEPGRGRNPADPAGLPLGYDPDAERGPSEQDQRHRLVVSGVFDLPRGFSVAAIATVGSGRPFNVTAGQDLNGDGAPDADRPRTSLADPASTIGRNAGLLPAEASFDVRLAWRHRLRGPSSIEWVAEVFNLFNRVNVLDVNGVFGPGPYPAGGAPGFGRYTRTAPPRQVQLSLRVRF